MYTHPAYSLRYAMSCLLMHGLLTHPADFNLLIVGVFERTHRMLECNLAPPPPSTLPQIHPKAHSSHRCKCTHAKQQEWPLIRTKIMAAQSACTQDTTLAITLIRYQREHTEVGQEDTSGHTEHRVAHLWGQDNGGTTGHLSVQWQALARHQHLWSRVVRSLFFGWAARLASWLEKTEKIGRLNALNHTRC